MARDRTGVPVIIAAAVPLLAMEVGVGFLRFQVRRKRGVRGFRRAPANWGDVLLHGRRVLGARKQACPEVEIRGRRLPPEGHLVPLLLVRTALPE
jgi:hypothetical protein